MFCSHYEEGAKDAKETASGLCNGSCFLFIYLFFKTEMCANTKQSIYFSQARQIEKYAMLQTARLLFKCE